MIKDQMTEVSEYNQNWCQIYLTSLTLGLMVQYGIEICAVWLKSYGHQNQLENIILDQYIC